MSQVCLLPDKINAFKEALKDKEIKITDLLSMSTEERTALFENYAGKDGAKAVNTLFEQKLVLKNRMEGLKNFVRKMGQEGRYNPAKIAELEKSVDEWRAKQQERVFSPKENEAFLNDLADKAVGTHISREVAAKVFELSQQARAAKETNPKLSGVSDEYLSAKQELDKYIDAQKPSSTAANIGKNLSIIGRNNLLFNPSTPLKTAVSEVVNSTMDFVTRRIAQLSTGGGNGELVKQANAEAWDTFRKTGQNTAAMESLDDTHMFGEKSFNPPENQSSSHGAVKAVETAVRATAKASNKVIIDWAHNYPFTKFYQKTFFDMTNLTASKIAESEGLAGDEAKTRAGDIFKDAARIEPQTAEGAMVRLEAQKQAARITSTNNTVVSTFALGVKNALNKATPGFPLGDYIMPIAKIPANVIANGIENAGVGIPLGVRDIFKGREKIQSPDLETRYEGMAQFAGGIQKLARTFGSLGVAFYLASQLQKQDFRQDQYGTSYVKIGNTWINMEYIAAISPALAGAMTVKQKQTPSDGVAGIAGEYGAGALTGLKNAPGINEANSLITSITNSNYATGVMKYAHNFFTSRGVPAFIPHMLSGRPIERLFFGAHGVETTQEVAQDTAASKAKSRATRIANQRAKAQ